MPSTGRELRVATTAARDSPTVARSSSAGSRLSSRGSRVSATSSSRAGPRRGDPRVGSPDRSAARTASPPGGTVAAGASLTALSFASPKSSSRAMPFSSTITFAGLTSRCRIPRRCAASSPRAIPIASSHTSRHGTGRGT